MLMLYPTGVTRNASRDRLVRMGSSPTVRACSSPKRVTSGMPVGVANALRRGENLVASTALLSSLGARKTSLRARVPTEVAVDAHPGKRVSLTGATMENVRKGSIIIRLGVQCMVTSKSL